VFSIIVQGGLVGRIVKRLGERRALLFGMACGTVGFTLYGLAPSGYWFWAAMPIAALWGVANPAAQALMTRHVSPQEQGRLQGSIGSLNSIAGILGPAMFTQTLAAVAVADVHSFWAGATFWLAAAMVGLGGFVAWRVTRGEPDAAPANPAPG
jgi:DHA1 family tetracycline resistance protein-like MFS transporter